MSKPPKVTVLQSSFNDETYIAAAIESILAQTFKDFEYIIINDGSHDKTGEIIDSYAANDTRIRVIHQKNQGLVAALNIGLKSARGIYIARMDGDDISLPNRLQKQVELLDSNPAVGLCGGSFEVMDEPGELRDTTYLPPHDAALKRRMFVGNPFAHGSVMYRKGIVRDLGSYKDVGPIEDWDLWIRMAPDNQFAAIEQPIFRFRRNGAGVSSSNHTLQTKLKAQYLDMLWRSPPRYVSRSNIRQELRSLESQQSRKEVARDLATVSMKHARYGRYFHSLRQAGALAASGWTGLWAMLQKIIHMSPLGALKTRARSLT